MATTQSIVDNNEKKAIIVPRNLLKALRSAVMTNAKPWDVRSSDRELLDEAVLQTWELLVSQGHDPYVYYVGTMDNDGYRWFDSEVVSKVQGDSKIRDKGRFIAAMVALYLKGEQALPYISRSRRLRCPAITEEGKAIIDRTLSQVPAAKSGVSSFVPTSYPGEI